MAEYVVVDKEKLESDLTIVADSIRAKSGTTEGLAFPLGMKEVVESIDTSKEEQEKTISITENGTTEVTPDEGKVLSKVTVNVEVESGGGVDYLCKRINKNADPYSYSNDEITEMKSMVFASDTNLEYISMSALERMPQQCFENCSNLKGFYFPNVIYTDGNRHFNYCTSLTTVKFEKLKVNANVPFFQNCTSLEKIDCLTTPKTPNNCCSGCTNLKAVIYRGDTVSISAGTDSFNNTPIANGTGYIYVARELIEEYKVATNWSTLYASQPNVFRALEDYTVDGTITGELDESKI